ncbi:hypothetical protein [Levilactobacillus bambusae]|uniref:Bacterial Ig domain-containing protein n=1 Tax=Levilactobacillus bambusae TaxID=2024736 RepID=A0A2V1MZ79_9LACO|nr:hypothetical protein [Levilactobacillus bambusae]PWG00279.1 hypothetical protein DCM90_04935 [Levilactobacillus bambusae]
MKKELTGIAIIALGLGLTGCGMGGQNAAVKLTTTKSTVTPNGAAAKVSGKATPKSTIHYTLNGKQSKTVKVKKSGTYKIYVTPKTTAQTVKLTAKINHKSSKTKKVDIKAAKPLTKYTTFATAYNTAIKKANGSQTIDTTGKIGRYHVGSDTQPISVTTTKNGDLLGVSDSMKDKRNRTLYEQQVTAAGQAFGFTDKEAKSLLTRSEKTPKKAYMATHKNIRMEIKTTKTNGNEKIVTTFSHHGA